MSARAARAATAPAPSRPRREHAPPHRAPERVPAPRRRSAPRARPRVRLGMLVIPLIALLLGGIVWINVSKLAFTAETGRVVEQARVAEAENVRLRAQLDRAEATVVDRAQLRLGMGLPAASSITPLRVPAP